MARAAASSNDDGPVAVVRRIIARRLGTVLVDEKSQIFRCMTKDAHRLLPNGSDFVLFKPKGKNFPALWPDVLARVTDDRPLLYSKAVNGCNAIHTWVLPRAMVAKMDAVLATDAETTNERDTNMVLKDQEWFWRPAGVNRYHMQIKVTDRYQEWMLDPAEAGELQEAFRRPRKTK